MKKLLLIGLFVFLWNHAFSQRNELFQIWDIATEDVNKYTYWPKYNVPDPDSYRFHEYDLRDTTNTQWKWWKKYPYYKRLARSIMKKGKFEFDRQNDTLMFLFGYHLTINVPDYVIAKSSRSENIYFVSAPGIIHGITPITKEFRRGNEAFKAQYEGNVEKFRELFLKYGYYEGGETVLRIVIKDGEVVSPSYLWIYPDIRLPD